MFVWLLCRDQFSAVGAEQEGKSGPQQVSGVNYCSTEWHVISVHLCETTQQDLVWEVVVVVVVIVAAAAVVVVVVVNLPL